MVTLDRDSIQGPRATSPERGRLAGVLLRESYRTKVLPSNPTARRVRARRWIWLLAPWGCFVEPPVPVLEAMEDSSGVATSGVAESEGDAETHAESDTSTATAASAGSSSSDDDDSGSSDVAIDCTPAPDGIVAWWRGDGDTVDSVGGEPASAMGGMQPNGVGYVGEAFRFDGIDDALSVGDSPAIAAMTYAFTIEAWLRLDDLEPPAGEGEMSLGDMEIVGKMAAGLEPNADGWRLFKQTDADELWFCVGATGNGCRADGSNTVRTAAVAAGAWLHVAAVKDGERIAIFLDGQLADDGMLVDAVDTATVPVSLGASTAELDAVYDSFFFGMIDELALYDRALSDDEISLLASASAGKCRD